jgi:uncharacterized membrane protein YGL010W
VPGLSRRYVVLNNGLCVAIVYGLYYLTLEPFAGLTWFLTHGIGCYAIATALYQVRTAHPRLFGAVWLGVGWIS